MAETLTFEDTTETTTIDNLSAEEQDSLQVGEAMQEAEDTRLAGKYENAQELEKAYIELEKKLGQQSNESKEEAVEETIVLTTVTRTCDVCGFVAEAANAAGAASKMTFYKKKCQQEGCS